MRSDALKDFLERYEPLFVLTGAGCSTESGIPDYRDLDGAWKHVRPVMFKDFVQSHIARGRYWARSLIGYERFRRAPPNDAHHALAELERQGRVTLLVTQNVDRLHQAAGSKRVIDLHGRLDLVRCMGCEKTVPREAIQRELLRRNPDWSAYTAVAAPDGDADLVDADFSAFEIPACAECGGVLKPDVVFFGESVPRERVEAAMAGLEASNGVLIVGSSLMIYSGYRFARATASSGKPMAAVNLGVTRADDLLALKIEAPCASALVQALG